MVSDTRGKVPSFCPRPVCQSAQAWGPNGTTRVLWGWSSRPNIANRSRSLGKPGQLDKALGARRDRSHKAIGDVVRTASSPDGLPGVDQT